jgi:hypothetical protein
VKITVTNVETKFLELFQNRVDHKGKEVSFIDWQPTQINDEAVASQVQEIKRCQSKEIPIIVFDRHSSMTEDEIIFLHKKTKVKLFEPAVVARPGFEFMPYWVHFREYKYSDFKENRRFQTGYKGIKFTKDLESNILSVIKDKLTIGLDVKLPQDKYDVLKSIVCIDRFEYLDLDTMILTGTEDDYNRGVLPDIEPLMQSGTVPLLYHKHKWLHSLFKNFVIYDHNDIRWSAKLYKNCGIGFIEDVQKNILEYLPEMEASNFVDSLLEKADKL